ncbi:MAG TPA: glycosyltransferase [Micromonosporaceae bacterium]|nr:glycosyltransferase [Micromonosporaceae bacterium]
MRIVLVSTYLPRRCGLATFTGDLRDALREVAPRWDIGVCAVDRDGLSYGPEVTTVIRQDTPADYRAAARRIAQAGTDLVLIQHEYGIFGGPDGAHVLELARALRRESVPYIVTLHTVLSKPSQGQAATLAELCAHAARVTVFTETAASLAVSTGLVDPVTVVVVPHGAPPVLRTLVDPDVASPAVRDVLERMGERRVLATFGLIGPSKGLEHAIAALPRVVDRHPDVCYLIAGASHPEEVRQRGESYRQSLVDLAARLGVEEHLHFVDAFLSEPELAVLLGRTHLYLTPYRSPEQICSGALTFAVAAGCPVVSTDYWYARDLLAPGPDGLAAGVLVPCEDIDAIAREVTLMFDDNDARHRAYQAADAVGATLTWPSVASRLVEVTRAAARSSRAAPTRHVLPPLRLDHLDRITDEIGIIQFARGAEPDPDSGYCVDDVARLGIVAAGLSTLPSLRDPRPTRWVASAVRFLAAATPAAAVPGRVDREIGMRNLMSYDGSWLDGPHLGDHVGRAIWGLGVMAASDVPADSRVRAHRLLLDVVPMLAHEEFARPHAYALLGLARLADPTPALRTALAASADRLRELGAGDPDWPWCEPELTYDNARLPQALLLAGDRLGEAGLVRQAEDALRWYLEQVGLIGCGGDPALRCVGNFWRQAGCDGPAEGADEGDEQPLDAAAVVEALTDAWQVTRRWEYGRLAVRAFSWFHGVNRAGLSLYDEQTGGGRDGLGANYVNPNEGAESTLAYYQAMLALVHNGLMAAPGTAGAMTAWLVGRATSGAPVPVKGAGVR